MGTFLTGGPLNGMKMLLGYVLANVAAGAPLLGEALRGFVENPNASNGISVIAQLLLLWGGAHDIVKKIKV